jgi:hypothetical protein
MLKKLITNAGAVKLCSDDLVRLFILWIDQYHGVHLAVIKEVYRDPGTGQPRSSFSCIGRDACESRECLPMPGMRAALARTDECGVRLGHLHCFGDLANFFAFEQWLNSLDVTFFGQPARQSFLVPPRIRHGVVADTFGDSLLDSSSLGT